MSATPGASGPDPAKSQASDPAVVDDAGFPWQRVHPATPYLRGWLAIVVIVFASGRQWFDGLFTGDGLSDISGALPWIVGGTVLALIIIVALFYVSWRFTKYRITDTQVQLRTGVISRKESDARLDRVQAVDIGRPLLPRLFGLSELRFEVADGGSSAFRLQFLAAGQAEVLRADILRRAAGAKAATEAGAAGGTGTAGAHQRLTERASGWAQRAVADLSGEDVYGKLPGGTADERELVRVPPGRILGATALRILPWAFLMAVAVIAVAIWAESGVVLGVVIPGGIAVVGGFWSELNAGYGFRASWSTDGLRLKHGLTDTQHRTVPPGRVQAIMIQRPLTWRLFGWVRVEANVAGYGNSEEGKDESRSVVLPVGTFQEAIAILATLLPDPGVDDAMGTLTRGLDGSGGDEFVTTPRGARWLAPLAGGRQGFLATRTVLLIRTGRLSRTLSLVPHARTQGVLASQGWLARLAGVAAVELATTAGPVPTSIPHVDAAVASELVTSQVRRTAESARREDRNHWLAQDGGQVARPQEEQS
ncbi:PH domain-containing protein [Galactobacter caseinivorans]|uniref:YdbS-like PH domain-containing protein n=1 Tax=Galactobacter caseinivorans TaxID=2676123 RepID=A0A496PFA1_9MICC|nr:PH domain-containing protein [Galactobacter caseinivorans]RKW69379.1 hypothetical protein DWQ67_13455 [Galactobacter caseinivorans]